MTTVTICKGGCKPVWRGSLDACPQCDAETRTTELVEPTTLGDFYEGQE